MATTIPSKIRELAREYYSYHGEKCRVTDKIQRTVFNGFEHYKEEAYVCRVTDKCEHVNYTIITDNIDADGKTYVTEYDFAKADKMALVDSWVHEFDQEDE